MHAEAVTSTWSSRAYRAAERGDALSHKFHQLYSHWTLDGRFQSGFELSLRYRRSSGFRIVEAHCDPFVGRRGALELAAGDAETVSMQLVVSGRERMICGEDEVELAAGDVLIWDTTRPMEFHVLERLHKVSMMMPLARLRSWLPVADGIAPRKLARDSRGATLMSTFLSAVSPQFFDGDLAHPEALGEAAAGLLVNVLDTEARADPAALREVQLLWVRRYICEHLADPELSPSTIAAGCRISVRYLHWLFEPTGTTVLQYVIQQRLERCRRELANPAMKNRKIIDIAFSWGFQNATHFAKRFKAEFGMTPHDFRVAELGS